MKYPTARGNSDHLFIAGMAVALLIAGSPIWARTGDAPHIDEVKAAFAYKFVSFVEWPDETFDNDDDPFRIGVVSDRDFLAIFEAAVADKQILGRQIAVISSMDTGDLETCQIVFFSASASEEPERLLAALRGDPVLTIGDSENFAQRGGIIRLFEEGRRLRFEINLDAAKRAELRISSKLLELASAVVGNAALEE